jgi:hypothetical protein
VSASCTARLVELVEPYHRLTPLLWFFQGSVRESHRHHRISGRHCRRCPCSVSFPLRRAPGRDRVTATTSHPPSTSCLGWIPEDPIPTLDFKLSAVPTPPPVRSSTPQHFFFDPPARVPPHLACASQPVQDYIRRPSRHRSRRCRLEHRHHRWVVSPLRRPVSA